MWIWILDKDSSLFTEVSVLGWYLSILDRRGHRGLLASSPAAPYGDTILIAKSKDVCSFCYFCGNKPFTIDSWSRTLGDMALELEIEVLGLKFR